MDLSIIDTLYFSPLLFPARPYHRLVKDDKLDPEHYNNPLNDAIKARNLFYDEVNIFQRADENLKQVYYLLLSNVREFADFFVYIGYSTDSTDTEAPVVEDRYQLRLPRRLGGRDKPRICDRRMDGKC